jgi:hypothetical protein
LRPFSKIGVFGKLLVSSNENHKKKSRVLMVFVFFE